MREGHISRAFDGALAALHIRVLEMGGLVHAQVREAAAAYTDWDPVAAGRVIDRQTDVATYSEALHQDHISLIARRQPVASDLRAIIALSKIVAELERSDTEAIKIARTVLQPEGRPARGAGADVRHIARLACSLLRSALDALDTVDAALAEEVTAQDPELDAEYAAGLRRLLTRAMEDPRSMQGVIDTAFVLKGLEHVGDRARSVAQHVRVIAEEGVSRPASAAGAAEPPRREPNPDHPAEAPPAP
jgi:phosphate transport system protein